MRVGLELISILIITLLLLTKEVSNRKAGHRSDKWSIKNPFEVMAKLVRLSTTSSEPKNIVQLSEQHHLSQSNWLSGSINETRQQDQPAVTEVAVRDVAGPSVGRQHLPAKLTRMSVKSLIDSNRPSVLDFVRDKNELPKMFYMEQFIRQQEDSFLKATDYSPPCQDSSDCHDTSLDYDNPPKQFHRHRPTQQPAVVPLLSQHHQNNRRPQINAHPFPLIIKGSLQGAGLLKYFQLTPDD